MKNPVLVLGWVPRIVVSIARSLHRHGVPVDVSNSVSGGAIRSRAIREFVRLPHSYSAPAEFVSVLRALIRARGYDMLIPADDQALTAVMEHYDCLKDLLHVACPPPSITCLVLNKASTLAMAEKCGIRAPKTIVVSHSTQLDELVDALPFPWILKPAEKEQHEEEFKSCKVTTAADLRERFPTPREFTPNILLQEYCEGAGVGVEMLMDKGECRAVFQHRRLKEFPHSGGYAVIAVAELPDASLVQSSLTLLRALKWDGIAMVEFKVNPVDGSAVLMEINGRYWGSIGLPGVAGIDFPLYHWKLVHGEALNVPDTYTVGVRWRWTAGYMARLHDLLAAAPRSMAARAALSDNLLHFPEDFGFRVRDPILRFSDPMPAVIELLRTGKHLLGSDLDALRRRLPFRRHTG